jgi:deoxyribonuclease V
MWPTEAKALIALQRELAQRSPALWHEPDRSVDVAACWVCFPKGVTGPGAAGDPIWAAAVLVRGGHTLQEAVVSGRAAAPYVPGLFALRAGAVLEGVVQRLTQRPDVLLLDATARDHPRGAGLALHLGAALDVPTVGVTHRPLVAEGEWPDDRRGATSPLVLDGETVGSWMRTRVHTRPLAVHPGWRTDLPTAEQVVEATTRRHRTPEPLRRARRAARLARSSRAELHDQRG